MRGSGVPWKRLCFKPSLLLLNGILGVASKTVFLIDLVIFRLELCTPKENNCQYGRLLPYFKWNIVFIAFLDSSFNSMMTYIWVSYTYFHQLLRHLYLFVKLDSSRQFSNIFSETKTLTSEKMIFENCPVNCHIWQINVNIFSTTAENMYRESLCMSS